MTLWPSPGAGSFDLYRLPIGRGSVNSFERAGHGAESIVVSAPRIVRVIDLFARSCDEVPPHQDGFFKWLSTKQDGSSSLTRTHVNLIAPLREVTELAQLESLTVDCQLAFEDDHRVLEI